MKHPLVVSKLEDHFAKEFLDPLGIKYERQKWVGMFIFDFYIPENNLLIEIQGTYWHADPRVYKADTLNKTQKKNVKRDEIKSTVAKNFGFKLLSLYEGDIYFNPQSIHEILDAEVT